MMRRLRLETVIPVLFILFAAFVIGFLAPDVSASGGDMKRWVASLQLLPQRLERIGGPVAAEPGAGPLPLVDTYSAVMERLKADYYSKDAENDPAFERKVTYAGIRGMLHALGDPFTRFLDPEEYQKMREENEGNFQGIGAQLDTNSKGEVYIKEPLPGTPAERADVRKSDVIIAVDDKSIRGMDITDVVKLIRGERGTKVKITLQRPGAKAPISKTIVRDVVQFQMVKWKMLDDKSKIGYVRLYQFNEQSDQQFDDALTQLEKQRVKGLILDLRGNPGGLLQVAVDIGSRFLDSGPVVTIQERGGQKNPLYVKEDKHNHKRYPLVVLVDKSSASASEIVSGAIKDDGVGTLVGVTTFGKGRVQTIMPMGDGSAVAITTAKYLTPKGTDIHKKGIEPDVVVEQPEVEDLLKQLGVKNPDDVDLSDPKYDVQLTKAMDVLKVKMGLLPKSVLEKMQKTAKAEKS